MGRDAEEIAVIGGTGQQGFGLALRWAHAGYSVVIGSREANRAQQAAERLRAILGAHVSVRGMENAAAVAVSTLVVLTVPFEAQCSILKSLRASFKPGDVLIDVTVPLETAIGGRPSRLLGVWAGSAAEHAQQLVPPGVRVVSAFHNVSASALHELRRVIECDVIVCGDHAESKARVRPLVDAIPACRYVDGGPLENSRIVEALTALLISVNMRYRVRDAGIRITGIPA